MLPAAILARVDAQRDLTFTESVSILTNESTPNGEGGFTDNWVTAETEPGRLRKINHRPGDMQVQGSEVQPIVHFQVLMRPGVSVSVRNRLEVHGRTYIIRGHDSGRTGALCTIVDVDPMDEY